MLRHRQTAENQYIPQTSTRPGADRGLRPLALAMLLLLAAGCGRTTAPVWLVLDRVLSASATPVQPLILQSNTQGTGYAIP